MKDCLLSCAWVISFLLIFALLNITVSTYFSAGKINIPWEFNEYNISFKDNKIVSFGVLPDSQYYSAYNPDTLEAQRDWVVNAYEDNKISFVIHLGDFVEHGNSIEIEWIRAKSAFNSILDHGIPLAIVAGNHDGEINNYLQYEEFLLSFNELKQLSGSNQSSFKIVNEILLLNLQMLDTSNSFDISIYNWAENVLNQYDYLPVILTSHYVISDCNDDIAPYIKNLVFNHCNIKLSIGGHYFTCGGENSVSIQNNCNQESLLIISNYQNRKKGGEGWLRLHSFVYNNNSIIGLCTETISSLTGEFEMDNNSNFYYSYLENKEYPLICGFGHFEYIPSGAIFVMIVFATLFWLVYFIVGNKYKKYYLNKS